jgi:hypothetical protein
MMGWWEKKDEEWVKKGCWGVLHFLSCRYPFSNTHIQRLKIYDYVSGSPFKNSELIEEGTEFYSFLFHKAQYILNAMVESNEYLLHGKATR